MLAADSKTENPMATVLLDCLSPVGITYDDRKWSISIMSSLPPLIYGNSSAVMRSSTSSTTKEHGYTTFIG